MTWAGIIVVVLLLGFVVGLLGFLLVFAEPDSVPREEWRFKPGDQLW